MTGTPLTIEAINHMSADAFRDAFGAIAEKSAWVAEAAGARRPFAGRADAVVAFQDALTSASREAQLAVLRAHPDLAGRAALAGDLERASKEEQAGAGLDSLSADELARFTDFNIRYRARFGFPFILAVRGATKYDILEAFAARIDNSAESEFSTAIKQVCRIMTFRLEDAIAGQGEGPATAQPEISIVSDAIDRAWSDQVAFLKELVRVPSDNPPGDCLAHAERSAALLADLGFEVERHRVPDALVERYGMIGVENLIVRRRFGSGSGPTIALNAHGDVVPPGEGWTTDPYGAEERDGAVYGRGVAVSKSDFATYAFALKALEEEADALDGTIELHLTYDEEAGGFVGPKWLLDEGLSKPDYAFSAGFSYAIVTAHNGCLHLEVTVAGKQAHAALPSSGIDALEAATAVLTALYAERHALGATTSATPGIGSPQLTVGLISGGINTNVVPDRVTLRVDRRIIPDEDGAAVEADLIERIEQAVQAVPGATVSCRRIMLAEPLRQLPGAETLIDAVQPAAQDIFGVEINTTGVPLYTDARHYATAGIPTILYGAGPRSILEANAHGADEHLQLSDLRSATEVIYRALKTLIAR